MRTKHYRMIKKSLACALSMAMLAGRQKQTMVIIN